VEDRQCNLTKRIQTTKGYATVQRCFPTTAESGQIQFWSRAGKSDTAKGRTTLRGTRESG